MTKQYAQEHILATLKDTLIEAVDADVDPTLVPAMLIYAGKVVKNLGVAQEEAKPWFEDDLKPALIDAVMRSRDRSLAHVEDDDPEVTLDSSIPVGVTLQ